MQVLTPGHALPTARITQVLTPARPAGAAVRRLQPIRVEQTETAVREAPPEQCLSSHPDAVRRHAERQARRQRELEERARSQAAQQAGLKWYEDFPGDGPQNMHLVRSPEEYRQLCKQAMDQNKLLVAKYFTEECFVCKSMHPKIKQIARDNPDVIWAKMNGSEPQMEALFHSMEITKVPYFHMVVDGKLVSQMSASLSPEKLAMLRAELALHKPVAAATQAARDQAV